MMFGKGFRQKTLTKEVEFEFRVSRESTSNQLSFDWPKFLMKRFNKKGSKLYSTLLIDGLDLLEYRKQFCIGAI